MSPWLRMSPLRSKIQIAFLGETKRTIPRSRPASGRASRAGLVQDAACGTGAQRRRVLDQTEHGAMLVQVGTPASSKTATPNHVLPVIPGDRNELLDCHSEATRSRSPVSPDDQQRSCCDDQLNPPNTPRSSSATAVVEAGVRPSMGSVGDAYDNAMCESFFATLEC